MKVLIVEDELDWQDILKEYVGIALRGINASDESIYVAKNYHEAREAIEIKGPWNLLVADITLDQSKQDLGRNLGQVLITLAHEKKIPTIVVSGTISVSDAGGFLRQFHVIDCFSKEDFASFESTFVNDVRQACISSQESKTTVNNSALLSERFTSIEPTQDFSNGYALCIGIGNYSNINSLRKTIADARDIHRVFLSNGYSDKNARLLLDQDATKSNISDSLNWIAESARKEDTVVIFFSGHGLRRLGGFYPGEYLCPVDVNLNSLEETCISSKEFTSALNSINADRLAIFLDSCHSGGVGDMKGYGSNLKSGLSEDAYKFIAEGNFQSKQGRVIIASCKSNEVSWELPEMNNGLFTNYLLEGICGGAARLDGKVPIMRLFEYISDRVPQHCAQHPFMKAYSENFIIAISRPQ